MRSKFVKRNFYTPESYTFKSDHVIPSLTPLISSSRPHHQQSKFSMRLSHKSSVGIHTTDGETLNKSSVDSSLPSDKV
jgi:hypothetical protein